MSDYKRNITFGQRFEYGIYQFLDHFKGRDWVFRKFGKRRHKFYRNLLEDLKKSGEGKLIPIERRKGLTKEEFLKHYVRKGIPVVLEGAAKDWDCVKKWSLEYFKELHGKDEIVIVELLADGAPYETITLNGVIDNIRAGGKKYYRFYPLLVRHPEHIKDFDYKWLVERKTKHALFDAFQVFMGGKDSITDTHSANPPNLFVQVYGEKSWILYPPYYSVVIDPDPVQNIYRNAPFRGKNKEPFNPFKPDYSPPNELYKYVDGISVSLKPGDVLWNPPFWWHAVKNETDSIGVGYRWADPRYAFGIAPLYMFLDLFSKNPKLSKSYELMREDSNLVWLSATGQLDEYIKKQGEKEEALKKQKV